MTAPNRNTLWGRAIASELARSGVQTACISPGSRSTPLTVALDEHSDIRTISALDERSAAYFALGRARRTGEVTPLVSTSGTAAANYHPAVIEANQGRVPLLLLTADRPPELRESGANQTIDQQKLYGGSVRWDKELPEPRAENRTLRSLRTDICRAVGIAEGTPAGPVHLNVPFAKPLEPTPVEGDVPASLSALATAGRGEETPFVRRTAGTTEPDERDLRLVAESLAVDRGLVVAGPADPPGLDPEAVTALSHNRISDSHRSAVGTPVWRTHTRCTRHWRLRRICRHRGDRRVARPRSGRPTGRVADLETAQKIPRRNRLATVRGRSRGRVARSRVYRD